MASRPLPLHPPIPGLASPVPPDKWAAQRAKERITVRDYRTLPHRNGTMQALYQGAELAYRGRSTPCNH